MLPVLSWLALVCDVSLAVRLCFSGAHKGLLTESAAADRHSVMREASL